jgi:MFS family permease
MLALPSDRRIKVVLLLSLLYNFVVQLTFPYSILFAETLGASGFDIGLVNCISSLAVFLTSAHVGLAVERYSMKKLMILDIICEIAAMAVFIAATDWRWLIIAFILQGQIIRITPLIDVIFVSFTDFQERAALISFSRVLWGFVGIFAPLIASTIVTCFGGITSKGIRPLFYVSLALLLIILFILFYALDEVSIARNMGGGNKLKEESIIKGYSSFFKVERYAKRWIVLRFFRDGFISLLQIFTPLWIINVKGASPTLLGVLSSVSVISAMVMQVPVSMLSNKLGRKKTFFLFTIFYCLGTLTLIFASDFHLLILASILGIGYGGIGGTAYTPLLTMWWETVPTNNRGKLYGIEGMIFASSKIMTSVLGGILWAHGLMEFALLSPVLIELMVVIPLLYSIPETLKFERSVAPTAHMI